MKFKVINAEPLQFHNEYGDLTGTILISASGDMILRPESGSSNAIIIGDQTTTGTVEFGTVAAPVTLDLLGGGTITSNGNTLYVGSAGDTVIINNPQLNNAMFTSSLNVTGSILVTGVVTASYFIGDFSGDGRALTNVTASYLNPLEQTVQLSGALIITGSTTISGSLTGSSGNTITSDALLQATLLYLSNNF
jgi:hypothetical protein